MLYRPSEAHNRRLFYRRQPKFNPEKYDPLSSTHMKIMMRLYQFFHAMEPGSGKVLKEDLTARLFKDDGGVTKNQVGKTLEAVVQYRTSFQENARASNGWTNRMFWRWQEPKDYAYGLEFFMFTTWLSAWLKSLGEELTSENIEEELEVIRDMSWEEQYKFIEEFHASSAPRIYIGDTARTREEQVPAEELGSTEMIVRGTQRITTDDGKVFDVPILPGRQE